jgi:glycosyltransferase involved in cell wall biosynthesis
LVIIGSGQDEKKLRRFADDKIQFLGWQSDDVLRNHLQRCAALLFPGEEDFGIVPVEAQACGAPVIAFGQGGATETVVPWPKPNATGIWFDEQNVDCLGWAIEQFERVRDDFDPQRLRTHALRFRAERFDEEVFGFVESVIRRGKRKAAA